MDRDPRCMDILDFALEDIVIFELPTLGAVEAFAERLRPRWDGWSDTDDQMWLFTAQLESDADVADLFRAAQELVAQLDHLAATLAVVRGQLVRMGVTEETDLQQQLATEVWGLREELGAAAQGMDQAFSNASEPAALPELPAGQNAPL